MLRPPTANESLPKRRSPAEGRERVDFHLLYLAISHNLEARLAHDHRQRRERESLAA